MVSKQFTKQSGYKEDVLLKRKIGIFLPSVLDEIHGALSLKYLKNNESVARKLVIK
jgi:hypothetical protein